MLLFQRKAEKQREAGPAAERTALVLARVICRVQEKAADWLSCKFGALPLHARKGCLLLFCLLLGGASAGLLAQALLPGQKPPPPLLTAPRVPPPGVVPAPQKPPDSLRPVLPPNFLQP